MDEACNCLVMGLAATGPSQRLLSVSFADTTLPLVTASPWQWMAKFDRRVKITFFESGESLVFDYLKLGRLMAPAHQGRPDSQANSR
jgi:hypothetical protein